MSIDFSLEYFEKINIKFDTLRTVLSFFSKLGYNISGLLLRTSEICSVDKKF